MRNIIQKLWPVIFKTTNYSERKVWYRCTCRQNAAAHTIIRTQSPPIGVRMFDSNEDLQLSCPPDFPEETLYVLLAEETAQSKQ